jgi:hypothetical protein
MSMPKSGKKLVLGIAEDKNTRDGRWEKSGIQKVALVLHSYRCSVLQTSFLAFI